MKKFNIGIILFILFVFQSCSENNGFKIKGKVTGGTIKKVILEKIEGQVIELDSAEISSNGEFEIYGNADEKAIYRLNFEGKKAIDLVLDNTSDVEVNFDATGPMAAYEIKGSPLSLQLKEVNDILYQTFQKVNALQQQYAQSVNDPNIAQIQKKLEQSYFEILNLQVQLIQDYVKSHPDFLVKLYALSYLNAEENYNFIDQVFKENALAIDSFKYAQQFYARFSEIKMLNIGEIAPEINLPNPKGELIALSSLKGQVVLLDFWASWCGPCRKENPNNVLLYNKYHAKGFTIYGVSLDKNKEAWEKAIMDDGLTWNQVSDLKYWASDAAKLYKVEAIPFTVLLDKEGRIVAKNLRGAELATKVQQLLK